MREQGWVKKDVWILPENSDALREIERTLRVSIINTEKGNPTVAKPRETWTINSLFSAMENHSLFTEGSAKIRMVEGSHPCIEVVMLELGDLPIYVTVSGEQIIADAVLWPLAMVKDTSALNEEVLRTHKLFPLSTISLDRFFDGSDYYTIFGSLSSASLLQSVIFEIETLAANAIKATEAYGEHLVTESLA